jgi:hypothetical protein
MVGVALTMLIKSNPNIKQIVLAAIMGESLFLREN